jgi:glutamine amidotransferase-like uncharacterized protein
MAVTKIGTGFTDEIRKFDEQLALFDGGALFLGDGGYEGGEAAAAFADQAAAEAELLASFDEVSDLAENPGNIDSTSVQHKTKKNVIAGKRTTKVQLNIAGISQARKNWMESELNLKARTIVLQSSDKKHYMIFNGTRFKCDWKSDIDGVPEIPITAEFDGATAERVMFFHDLAAGA